MLGYEVCPRWFDGDGTVHRIGGWRSRSALWFANEEGFRKAVEAGEMAFWGDGYPYRYEATKESLVSVLSEVDDRHGCGMTPDRRDEVVKRINEEVLAGSVMVIEEWDQS